MAAPLLGLGLLTGGAATKIAGLNLLRGAGQAALAAAPFIPSVMQGLGGDPLAGAASGGATALAGKYGKTAQALTGIAAPMVMPALLGGVGNVANAITGGVGNVISGGQERQMARGESPTALGIGSGQGVGFDQNSIDMMGQMTQQQLDQQLNYLKATNPIYQANLDRQHQRYAQQVQQQGQITGALNRQMYMAQLAGNAQSQAGETNRSVLTASNPYVGKIFG